MALAVLVALASCEPVHGVPQAVVASRELVTAYPAITATVVYSNHTAFDPRGITVKSADGTAVLNSTSVATNSSAASVVAHLDPFAGGTLTLNVGAGSVTPPLAEDVVVTFTYRAWPAL